MAATLRDAAAHMIGIYRPDLALEETFAIVDRNAQRQRDYWRADQMVEFRAKRRARRAQRRR